MQMALDSCLLEIIICVIVQIFHFPFILGVYLGCHWFDMEIVGWQKHWFLSKGKTPELIAEYNYLT